MSERGWRLVELRALAALSIGLLGLAGLAAPVSAQLGSGVFRPAAEWRTTELPDIDVHYPTSAEPWILPLLERMESIRTEVNSFVGRAPEGRVTVLVTDPLNLPNGYAVPLLDRPLAVFWPTPPGPQSGEHRGWGEVLFVHEYAHLAHLTFPPRNRGEQLLWRLAPLRPGPVLRRAPRWVVEGYATYVEGRLTGSARPHGVSRPAFLRSRALEGRLPTYAGLSGGEGFEDGASAYFVGSAFFEWLVEREDVGSPDRLWRRLSARESRTFSDAFTGVFGAPPDELYGHFVVDVTEQALQARAILQEAGMEEGDAWLERRWHTGAPALSPDGRLEAVVLHEPDGPSRLVVLETTPDKEEIERRERERERLVTSDPLDVPSVELGPPPRRTVATLHPVSGRAHQSPRFLPDGTSILVVRWEPLGDGSLRPDLFVWNHENETLRRVTRGAAVREADPSPDGRRAVGVRCVWGTCDLVIVDLESGTLSSLARGGPDRVYDGPRWAPDGESIVVSLREAGRWRIVSIVLGSEGSPDLSSSAASIQVLDPNDDVNRYHPAFLPDGRRIVAVSDAGGIANLEVLDLESGAIAPLTRLIGEAASPAPNPNDGYVHFLSRHARGWDIRRIHPDSVTPGEVVSLPPVLAPAARRRVAPPPPFEAADIPASRPYGWGPQRFNLVPAGGLDAGGSAGHLALTMGDPVGRAGVVLQGAAGDVGAWTGLALAGVVRRFPIPLRGEFHLARRDLEARGGLVSMEGSGEGTRHRFTFRIGGAGGSLSEREASVDDRASRGMLFASAGLRVESQMRTVTVSPVLDVEGAGGRTGGEAWGRLRFLVGTEIDVGVFGFALSGSHGRVEGSAPLERFRVGGGPHRLVDPGAVGQVVPAPLLPPALLVGERLTTGRASIGLGGPALFFWVGRASSDASNEGRWHRLVGAEHRLELPAQPQLGLPALSLAFGVGRSLDDPFRGKNRVHLSLGLRP